MIGKLRIRFLSYFAIFLVGSLTVYELFQLYELYSQKKEQLKQRTNRSLEKIANIHERTVDYERYQQMLQKELKDQYQNLIENHFDGVLTTNQEVSIKDTIIIENSKEEKYIVIKGVAKDTLSGVKTEQRTLIRDVQQLKAFVKNSKKGDAELSENITIHLNQEVLKYLFKKTQFVNEITLQAFKDNIVKSHQQRLQLHQLDSILRMEFKKDYLPDEFIYSITNEKQQSLTFYNPPVNYSSKKVEMAGYTVDLFPSDRFNDKLSLTVYFPRQRLFLLQEMKPFIILTVVLSLLMSVTIIFLIRTIRVQRRVAEIKTNFISNMTHEFKTPISTISLACQTVSGEELVSKDAFEQVEPYIKMINEENTRLGLLVEGILQSALISKGEISLQKTEIDLLQIVEEEIKKGYFRMSDNLELLLSVEGTPRKITADSLHVTNLISNLIDNAIKYSKGKPKIKIVLKYNKNVQVIVKDAGIGIPKEFIPKIFDNLFRVPTGNIHDVKGFGLGLTYVKAICDAHKWKIEVQSELGKGTAFHIQIKT